MVAKVTHVTDTLGRSRNSANKGVIIEGITPMVCIFCKHYITCIEFDLDLHLYENHRTELARLPISKYSPNSKIEYVIEQGRKIGKSLQTLSKEDAEKLGFASSLLL